MRLPQSAASRSLAKRLPTPTSPRGSTVLRKKSASPTPTSVPRPRAPSREPVLLLARRPRRGSRSAPPSTSHPRRCAAPSRESADMSRIQQWIAGTAVAVLVIVAAGWFLAIAPQKHKVSNLGSQAGQQEQNNSGLRTRLAQLTTAQQAVPSEQAEVAAITQKIPSDPAMPSYVRALTV